VQLTAATPSDPAAFDTDPAWSWSGEAIAFSREIDTGSDIWVVNPTCRPFCPEAGPSAGG